MRSWDNEKESIKATALAYEHTLRDYVPESNLFKYMDSFMDQVLRPWLQRLTAGTSEQNPIKIPEGLPIGEDLEYEDVVYTVFEDSEGTIWIESNINYSKNCDDKYAEYDLFSPYQIYDLIEKLKNYLHMELVLN